ncbi:unnamed protein product [Gongylonema pulchrum]|uniref:PFL domain-containing protein n=1 Tax=Gongylonema pulchrum TaxID=637853 RepID=A0A183DM49_9BILA|nr:unnamed protein product [Gongylonema pulchrum]
MSKITITSSEPKDRWMPAKELPSAEWVRRNDHIWEYGFYEPPPEKIAKGKLTFREALEVLRARCDWEFALKLDDKRRDILLPQIAESLEKHPATQRVEKEVLERVWAYFRPFERKETQYVCSSFLQ